MTASHRSATRLASALFLCAWFAGQPLALSQKTATPFTAADYERLLVRYRQSDASGAARALGWVPVERLEPALERLQAKALKASLAKAAILLHTETAWTRDETSPAHLRMARSWMIKLDAADRASFERRWYLLLSCYYLQGLNWEDRPVVEAAAKAFPDDIQLQLALGVFDETTGWMQRNDALLEQAETQYRAILSSAPDSAEAVIRLARVHHLLGRDDEALRRLQQGLKASHDPSLRLVTLLCLGDIYAKRKQAERALRSFRAAWALDPSCQMAAIALSHALQAAGEPRAALEVIQSFFYGKDGQPRRLQGRTDESDLWWRYALGPSYRFESLLRQLRKEARE